MQISLRKLSVVNGCQSDPDLQYVSPNICSWTMRPLDYASLELYVSWTMRPLCYASLVLCVPWTLRPLDYGFLGLCVPWTMCPLDNASVRLYVSWMKVPWMKSLMDEKYHGSFIHLMRHNMLNMTSLRV
jgi:hypothetical protein